MAVDRVIRKQRLSFAEKEANDRQYYKDEIDNIDVQGSSSTGHGGISEYRRKKVNYDLYNNIINLEDFEYVCAPFGSEAGELPATMANRDIVSGNIKILEGMEVKRPFPWRPIAVNAEATTRKETEEFGRMRDFVVAEIMKPIRERIQMKYAEQTQGRKLNDQEKQQIQAQIAEELQAQTPDRVRRYMERDHQDPAEMMAVHIMNYLMKEQDMPRKFQKGWKHAHLSAYDLYYVGIRNRKPVMESVNPIRFQHDMSPDMDFIEDGSWCSYEMRLTPGEVVSMFPDLTEKEIDDIYENYAYYQERGYQEHLFDFAVSNDDYEDSKYVRVLHCQWKGLRKIGFLTYIDQNGEEQMDYVDESYRLNLDQGDIHIDWEWLEETYEGYKIGPDIYKGMGPVEGQLKDLNTIRKAKLSYYGAVYDNMNSEPTCTMDRMKQYQYYYNIIMYRLELLLASDKGKKILMNIKAIPKEMGIDIEQWQYFFESTPFMWYNPDEEGGAYQDANTIAKTLDMSMISDINKYVELARYIKQECGEAIGVNDTIKGNIAASAEVGNTQHQLAQTATILEPMFEMHNYVKRNVLQAMIECAKVAWSNYDPGVLSYVLDDNTHQFFKIDQELLDSSTIGIFVSNASTAEESKQTIRQLAHAAMQGDKVNLSDVISVIRQTDVQEAEETLRVAEAKSEERMAKEQQAQRQSQEKIEQMRIQEKQEERAHDEKMLDKEYAHKKDLELQKQAMLSMGFNEDKDMDNDGTPDIMELYRNGRDAELKEKELDLKERERRDRKELDKEKIAVEKMKAKQPKSK